MVLMGDFVVGANATLPLGKDGAIENTVIEPSSFAGADSLSSRNTQRSFASTLQDSLRKNPDKVSLRNRLAIVLTIQGRFAEAEAHFKILLSRELSPHDRWFVLNNYGNFLFLIRQP